MVRATEFFECGDCGTRHEDYDFAQECCQPTVSRIYECGECGIDYPNEQDANECCARKDEQDDEGE